ncbi:hypothetical protein CDD83_802 [Cordyceps sp. RAO-2017]|nr:hypothetical protein CDD83_802 [Cordyceps sp. RAO-2017]
MKLLGIQIAAALVTVVAALPTPPNDSSDTDCIAWSHVCEKDESDQSENCTRVLRPCSEDDPWPLEQYQRDIQVFAAALCFHGFRVFQLTEHDCQACLKKCSHLPVFSDEGSSCMLHCARSANWTRRRREEKSKARRIPALPRTASS